MSDVQLDERFPHVHRGGAILVVLAFVAVFVAYPPPAIGVGPALGMGTLFLPLLLSAGALVASAVGGLALGHDLATLGTGVVSRIVIRVVALCSPVVVIGAYLQIVAGFDGIALLV